MGTLPVKSDDSTELTPVAEDELGQGEWMEKGAKLRPHVLSELMARYKKLRQAQVPIMRACELVGHAMGLKTDTVYRATVRMRPTTDLATAILASNAAKLAHRVVRKANVDQAIDVLSRTNIGVLAPVKQGGDGNGGQAFVIGVQVDSLGAVRVGVSHGDSTNLPTYTDPAPLPAPEPDTMGGDESYMDHETEPPPVPVRSQPPRTVRVAPPAPPKPLPPATGVLGRSQTTRRAIQKAEEKAEKQLQKRNRQEEKIAAKDAMAEIRRRLGQS